jgi:hypothetical protein
MPPITHADSACARAPDLSDCGIGLRCLQTERCESLNRSPRNVPIYVCGFFPMVQAAGLGRIPVTGIPRTKPALPPGWHKVPIKLVDAQRGTSAYAQRAPRQRLADIEAREKLSGQKHRF